MTNISTTGHKPDLDTLVSFQSVCKWFGHFQALQDINLSVKQGERVVVCGPSGSGKSTMIRCVNQLENHQQGTIHVCGREVYGNMKQLEQVRREVGMVFQSFNLFPHMSILQNVTLAPMRNSKLPAAEASDIAMHYLERVQIADQASKFPSQLSGGQQQRLCIARTIAVEPDIILMDEPCSALDPIATAAIEELILELKKDFTVVIVTHSMSQAARVSDYTGFMYIGRLVEFGETDKIFSDPELELTKRYITGRFG